MLSYLRRNQPLSFFRPMARYMSEVLPNMMSDAERLVEQKDYEGAQKKYKQVMDKYPNYADAYDRFYRLNFKIIGPLGLRQSEFDQLQKRYQEAVTQYGELQLDDKSFTANSTKINFP
jgi:hypothetical protein